MKTDRSYYASDSSTPEHRDCAVRALMTAGCTSYAQAWAMLQAEGRRARHGTHAFQLQSAIAKHFPGSMMHYHPRTARPTVNQFAAAHSEGHYVLFIRGHVLALVDGVQHNWKDQSRARVIWSWRLA